MYSNHSHNLQLLEQPQPVRLLKEEDEPLVFNKSLFFFFVTKKRYTTKNKRIEGQEKLKYNKEAKIQVKQPLSGKKRAREKEP